MHFYLSCTITCDKRDRIFQYEGIASFASLPSKVYALRKFIQESVSPSIRNVSRASERVHAWSTAPTQPGRRHAWVTCLRTVFRSRCECERVRASERASASSALNEFSSSPRARLVRRLHTCVCTRVACCVLRVCVRCCVLLERMVSADGGLLTPNERSFAVISLLRESCFIGGISTLLSPTRIFHSTFPPELSPASISKGEMPAPRIHTFENLTTENQTTRGESMPEIYFALVSDRYRE